MRRCKIWAHKIFSWKYLSEDLFCQFFLEHRVPHSWPPPRIPFRGCWKSAATAAHDLILVEVDGKCQWQVLTCSWHHLWNFPKEVSLSRAELLGCFTSMNWFLSPGNRSVQLNSVSHFRKGYCWWASKAMPLVQAIKYLIRGISIETKQTPPQN